MIHGSVAASTIAVLDEIGVPTETLLRREHLPTLDDHPTVYVPIVSAWAFAQKAADREGIWDLGFRMARQVPVERVSRWGPRVATAVTLGHAIKIMKDWIRLDIPNTRIGLEAKGNSMWFWRTHQPDRRSHPGYWFGEQYMLDHMVQIVRMAEGPDWLPRRLHVEAPAEAWAFKRPDFAGDALIEFGAARTAIELPPESLGRLLSSAGPDPAEEDLRGTGERPPLDLKASLHHVLKAVACEQGLTMEAAARISCRSERSFRRALASEGTGWREVVERVHLETAVELMDDPANSLADIAAILGYGHYPNFYRAFRRWTGETPRECRDKLAASI